MLVPRRDRDPSLWGREGSPARKIQSGRANAGVVVEFDREDGL